MDTRDWRPGADPTSSLASRGPMSQRTVTVPMCRGVAAGVVLITLRRHSRPGVQLTACASSTPEGAQVMSPPCLCRLAVWLAHVVRGLVRQCSRASCRAEPCDNFHVIIKCGCRLYRVRDYRRTSMSDIPLITTANGKAKDKRE